MNCSQARNLFDAYLDGELSRSLATELDAHRLHCPACRQELALLEVTGHVVAADPDGHAGLSEGFTDRLLACVEIPRPRPASRLRRALFIGTPVLAAAACVVFLITLVQSPGPEVRGEKDVREPAAVPGFDVAAESLVSQVESTWSTRTDSARSIMQFGQLTLEQMLGRLGLAQGSDAKGQEAPAPGSFDELIPNDEGRGRGADLIEDL